MILSGKIGPYRKDGGRGGTNLGEAPGILDEFRAGRSEPGASAARLIGAQSIGLRTRSAKPRCGRLR
jgi:hypothetical protein